MEAREKWLGEYMKGFWQGIKKHEEQAYCQFRSEQLVAGQKRISGTSALFGLEKQRGFQLEMVVVKIWKKGLVKYASVHVGELVSVGQSN